MVNHLKVTEHIFSLIKRYIFFHFIRWKKSFCNIIHVQYIREKSLCKGRSRYKPSNHNHSILFNNHLLCEFNVCWQNDRPAYTDFNSRLKMTLPSIGHVTNIHGFIPTSTRPIATKLVKMADWHVLTLTCTWQRRLYLQVTLQTFMALSLLLPGH